MENTRLSALIATASALSLVTLLPAHDLGGLPHGRDDVGPPVSLAAAATPTGSFVAPPNPAPATPVPAWATVRAMFDAFAPVVVTRTDDRFLYVESNSMPAHRMMVGIRAWQQQVPLPQPYRGENAWRIPLHPTAAADPLSAKAHFFRGAIALAANGVPIFNPIKNDGRTDTNLAGELDEFGGHSGRADDYHYHVAPVHLQSAVGAGSPIACALDGYPLYGFSEPDGSAPGPLDAFNGHSTPALGYHYHATKTYPYVNGGFHGEVTERDGQVSPQPRAHGVRPATTPLRGATITGFTTKDPRSYSLQYELNGTTHRVNYALTADGGATFEFVDGSGHAEAKSFAADARDGNEPRPPKNGKSEDRPPRDDAAPKGKRPPSDHAGPRREPDGNASRQPWPVAHAQELDANHDGVVTRAEMNAEAEKTFAGYDANHDGKLDTDEYAGAANVRSAMGGFVKQHAKEIDADGDGDGVISLDELRRVALRMFDKADRNHDGSLTTEELTVARRAE